MLTGHETLAEVFAATAHRCHRRTALVEPGGTGAGTSTWASLAAQVRLAALGWTSDASREGDEVVLVPGSGLRARTVALLVAAATGAVATIAPEGAAVGAPLDLERLAAAGGDVDERHPDRFESLLRARSPSDPLLRLGALVHTSASLLVAARSLGQALGMDGNGMLEVALPEASVAAVVAGSVVPCLTGDASCRPSDLEGPGAPEAELDHVVRLVVAGWAPSLAGEAPAARRRVRRQVPRATVVQVLDVAMLPTTGADAVAVASALSLDAAGGMVTGFGGDGTVGRPLPGVSVAVEGDGQVLVRGAAVPRGAPALRADGWLPTGVHGRLVGRDLVVDAAARAGAA